VQPPQLISFLRVTIRDSSKENMFGCDRRCIEPLKLVTQG
jgi:hypothetical protein